MAEAASKDGSVTNFYTTAQRSLQEAFETRSLADAHEAGIVHDVFTDAERDFIAGCDMFFLSTVDANGRPTVSYKGGSPGFVGFEGNDLVFPSYDGNGMYLSMGNLAETADVGLLFIDFETPRRLRVQGKARLVTDFERDAHVGTHVGAELLVIVRPDEIFVNCSRYVHHYRKVAPSRHVPTPGAPQTLASWKRIDILRPSLSDADRRRVDDLGTITREDYDDMVARRES